MFSDVVRHGHAGMVWGSEAYYQAMNGIDRQRVEQKKETCVVILCRAKNVYQSVL